MNQDNQMTETGKMSKEPAFYIEMSPHLRHIVMKRAYFLRGLRTRTMFCLEKIAGKAWLEITLIEKAKAEILPWDSAHSVAEKFKAELKAVSCGIIWQVFCGIKWQTFCGIICQ